MNLDPRRIGVGTRFRWDADYFEIVTTHFDAWVPEVAAKDLRADSLRRFAVAEVLYSSRAHLLGEDLTPLEVEHQEPVSVRWEAAPEGVRRIAREQAAHLRELETGYRSGSAETAAPGEPRAAYRPSKPMGQRVCAKAKELNVSPRTLYRWREQYRRYGEAGLISERDIAPGLGSRQDGRWLQTAREVKAEYTYLSKPTKTLVIAHTNARATARFGLEGIHLPSDATANRILVLEDKPDPLFTGSTKHTRDVAGRPQGVYGMLVPTRPGEYVLIDTTRLDVYAMDRATLRWVGLDLTVVMDWYSRCIIGLRLTPTTRAIDAAACVYECFHPKLAHPDWPQEAVWPAHGQPRNILVELEHLSPDSVFAATPAIMPDTLVIDHAKIFVGAHLHSVCRAAGMSIAPARMKIPYDKGPVERFFGTMRTGFLQTLPGYKGSDVYSRGIHPEKDATFFIDEMEAELRRWIAVDYHHAPHNGIGETGIWALEMSPARMFAHGVAIAGYIEAPRDPSLAYQFLDVRWRHRQAEGFQIDRRLYTGPVLDGYRTGEPSPYAAKGHRWPIHVNSDDVRTVYFFDSKYTREWHPLTWNMAKAMELPLSEDGLEFAKALVQLGKRPVDEKLAIAALRQRHQLDPALDPDERKAALRLAREQSSLAADLEKAAQHRKHHVGKAALAPPLSSIEAFQDELDDHDDGDEDFDDGQVADYRVMEDL